MNFCTHIFTHHKKYKKNPSLSRIKPIAGFKSTLTRKASHPRFLSEWTLGSKTLITEPLRNWCLNKTSSYFYHAGLSLLCSLFTHLRQLTKDRRHTPCNSAQLPLLLHRRSLRAGASHARVCGFGRASSKGPSRRVPTAARGGVARAKPAFVVPRGARGGGGVARGSGGPQPPPAPVAWLLGPHGRARTHLLVVLAQPDSHRIQLGHRIRAFPKLAGRAPVLPPVHGQARGRRRTPCTHGACCRSGTAARCRGHGHRPSSPPPGLALAAFPVRTRARARADATSFS